MAQTIDEVILSSTWLNNLCTGWGWETKNAVYDQWNGGEHIVQETQIMRFRASFTNPALQGSGGSDALDFIEFFNSRSGNAYGFLLDWPFYQNLTNQNIGTGDGSTTQFQFRFNIGDSSRPKYHTVKHFNDSTDATYVAYEDAAMDSGATFSSSGLVTYSSPPSNGAVLTADFHPYIPVRFDESSLMMNHQGNSVYSPNINVLGIIA